MVLNKGVGTCFNILIRWFSSHFFLCKFADMGNFQRAPLLLICL